MNSSGNQRLKRIREKIESMKNIDPNTFISKEELQELKRKHRIPERGILHSGRSQSNRAENAAPEAKEEQRQPMPVKKTFAFDTPFYRNFQSKYEKEPLKGLNTQKTENNVESVPLNKYNAEVGETQKKATVQINLPTESVCLIKLVPVNQSEEAIEKEKIEEVKPQEETIVPPKNNLLGSNQQPTKDQPVNIFQKLAAVQKQAEPTFNIFGKKLSTQNPSSSTQPSSLFGGKTFGTNIFSLNKPKEQQKKTELFDSNKLQITSIFKPIVSNLAAKEDIKTSSTPDFPVFSKHEEKRSYSQQSEPRTIFSRSNEGTLDFNAAKPQQVEVKSFSNDFFKKKEENKPEEKPLLSAQSSGNQQSLFANSSSSLFNNDSSKNLFSLPNKQEPKPAPAPFFAQNKGFFSQSQETTPSFAPTFNQSNTTGLFGNQVAETKPSTTPISISQPVQLPQQPEKQEISQNSLFSNNPKPTVNFFNNNNSNNEPKPQPTSLFEVNQELMPVNLNSLIYNKPEVKQLFGHAENKMEKQSLFNNKADDMPEKPKSLFPIRTEPQPVQSLFSNQPQAQPLFSQPFADSFPFETPMPTFGFLSNSQAPVPVEQAFPPTTGLFSNPKPTTVNIFQNNSVQAPKSEPELVHPEAPQEIPRKKSQKDEKKGNTATAIGPGGKTIELPSTSILFKSDKQNITSSGSDLFKAPVNNIFGSTEKSSSLFPNLGSSNESKPSGNLFTQNSSTPNFFSQNSGGSLFGNSANQLFGNQPALKTGSLFGNLESNLFNSQNSQNRAVQGQQQGQGDEEDDGPIQAEDDANPNLSTGKYDYIQTKNYFKEQASKFREGQKETMDGVTISIQQFQSSEDKFLYVRMPNKCIAFCGKFLKKITEVRVINNNKRNIEVKKILLCGENAGTVELAVVRIGFKEDSIGEKFLKEVENAIEKGK